MGTLHRRNGFYTVQTVCAIALHLNLALTWDGAFLFSLKKTHSVWFISVLNYGDTENVLINHLLLVIPMLYPCHYTNLCPHKPHKHVPPHTHTHTQYIHTVHAELARLLTNCNPLLIQKYITEMVSNVSVTCVTPVPWRRERRRNVRVTD